MLSDQTVIFKHGKNTHCFMVTFRVWQHSQVCDVVDHGPALNRKALVGDVVVINLQSSQWDPLTMFKKRKKGIIIFAK